MLVLLTFSLLFILLIHLQFFVFDTEIGLPASFFLIQKIHLHVSFFLFRCCWTNLFSLDFSLSITLLLFSYSCLAVNHFSFPSGVSVKDFHFLFIDCVCRFLLFLNSKCSIFGLSWTFCKSSSVSLTIKDTFNFKRNNPYL